MIRALIRHLGLTFIYFINGLDTIIFDKKEIVDFEFITDFIAKDKDKKAFIESLENRYNDDV